MYTDDSSDFFDLSISSHLASTRPAVKSTHSSVPWSLERRTDVGGGRSNFSDGGGFTFCWTVSWGYVFFLIANKTWEMTKGNMEVKRIDDFS